METKKFGETEIVSFVSTSKKIKETPTRRFLLTIILKREKNVCSTYRMNKNIRKRI